MGTVFFLSRDQLGSSFCCMMYQDPLPNFFPVPCEAVASLEIDSPLQIKRQFSVIFLTSRAQVASSCLDPLPWSTGWWSHPSCHLELYHGKHLRRLNLPCHLISMCTSYFQHQQGLASPPSSQKWIYSVSSCSNLMFLGLIWRWLLQEAPPEFTEK